MEGAGVFTRFRRWIAGSIRRKLTIFVVLVCLMLIGLFWLVAVQLLEPAYNTTIRRELETTLDTFVRVLDTAAEEELALRSYYVTGDGIVEGLSPDALERLNTELAENGLSVEHLCIDMAGEELTSVFLQDKLSTRCILHENDSSLGRSNKGSTDVLMRLRSGVFTEGEVYHESETQMVMGRLAGGGTLAVIVSTNLEQIPQAVGVLRQLMLGVSVLLIAISVLCAFVFSHWFTKPLRRLSLATQELAKGNYDVRVEEGGRDEIAQLGRDFNAMAEEIKHSTNLQRELFANVSHDLRTPLTLIKGFAETVRDLTGDEPQKRTEQLNIIVDETDRLSALVGNVLELSRVSSGVERLTLIRFDLTQLCDEVGDRYDAICQQNGYQCRFKGHQRLDIIGDPALLERALHNLLGNALHHIGEDGYIGLSVYATSRNTARVDVMDHGPGIKAEDLPYLFDRYYRSRADAGKPGTGLGLAITKAIFVASGYAYGVDSIEGHGATFWLEVPLAPPEKT